MKLFSILIFALSFSTARAGELRDQQTNDSMVFEIIYPAQGATLEDSNVKITLNEATITTEVANCTVEAAGAQTLKSKQHVDSSLFMYARAAALGGECGGDGFDVSMLLTVPVSAVIDTVVLPAVAYNSIKDSIADKSDRKIFKKLLTLDDTITVSHNQFRRLVQRAYHLHVEPKAPVQAEATN